MVEFQSSGSLDGRQHRAHTVPVPLAPLRDYVLCEALPDPQKSAKLLVVSSPNTAQRARVAAIGPACQLVKPGDTVLISRHIGQQVGDQVLVQEPYIMAWL